MFIPLTDQLQISQNHFKTPRFISNLHNQNCIRVCQEYWREHQCLENNSFTKFKDYRKALKAILIREFFANLAVFGFSRENLSRKTVEHNSPRKFIWRTFSNFVICESLSTILVIIFWDFSMFTKFSFHHKWNDASWWLINMLDTSCLMSCQKT